MKEKKIEKALLIHISTQLHHEIKKRALKRNVSMKDYVTAIINDQISKEEQYDKAI